MTTPEPTAGWVDKHGDVWHLGDDGLMHTPETRPFPREHVERKWGPLRPAREIVTAPEPTAEHVDAVARALSTTFWEACREDARAILTTDDPDAQAALAANLPREVMLAALVADGTLTERWRWSRDGMWIHGAEPPRERRLVTSWEAQP